MSSRTDANLVPTELARPRESWRADRAKTLTRGAVWATRLVGGVLVAIGAVLAAGGVWLVLLGGSVYYLVSGVGYAVSGALLLRRRPGGALLACALLAFTFLWALSEVSLDYWGLFPRLLLPAGLTLLALLAAVRLPANGWPRLTAGLALGLALAIAIEVAFAFVPHGEVHNVLPRSFLLGEKWTTPSDWSSYGRTTAGTRYSPFTEINRETVRDLKLAWTFRSGDNGPGIDEATPLQIGDHLYICSRARVTALDVDTGAMRWQFDPHVQRADWARCRGLGYYELPDAPRDGTASHTCARRIFAPTNDARLIALDASTGLPCPDFGKEGVVDLKQGMGSVDYGWYFQSSAPVVARGRIIIGGFSPDNLRAHSPSGGVRAFDARTGELVWAWDIGNPSVTRDPPPGGQYTRGTPNMWSTPAYDDALGLVYAPLGVETPDYFGAGRLPLSERYSSSVTALDIETGRPRWSVQTVHHDLWDYDVPSQPALVDLPDGHGGTVPALLQTTKRGQLFLLNRATGEAISRIVERPAPQRGAVPEERVSPTQPYSVGMPAIGAERLTEQRTWGMTALDQLWCRVSFREHRYDGEFTPVGLDRSLQYPGPLGGFNWGSVSVDPLNHIAFMNDIRLASSRTLVPRSDYPRWAARHPELGLHAHGIGLQPQVGAPYGVFVEAWVSPLGVPCNQPPLGTISAVDLVTRKLLWQVPAGTAEDATPLPMAMGMPTYAGTSVTAGGLVFFAGTQDFYLRAYDAETGKELWKYRLPVGSSATPMSYVSPKTGRQYVVVEVGGAARSPKTGDYLMAFALPKQAGRQAEALR